MHVIFREAERGHWPSDLKSECLLPEKSRILPPQPPEKKVNHRFKTWPNRNETAVLERFLSCVNRAFLPQYP